ncbi:c-type cytochrome [Persicitalea jodogahamensis]|uniref:Cytochrome c domain-containing protein n=1 Tax=Persicitalea jodogahamensis TaxID=402147 RepID=A0A8J3D8X1_9BACT|nr:cytochrome c [Persicitalea jodogahamensis]GHB77527.1 hypothetical protein GCM10007390_34620 [Persicitalea jodogahamensis]
MSNASMIVKVLCGLIAQCIASLLKGSSGFFAGAFFIMAFSSCQSTDELKKEQYYSEGYQLYTANCANCHQADGTGLANLYPPIKGSSYLDRNADLICIIKNGLAGEIQVAGKTYNRPMPANPKLADIEIAEIVTYVNITWGGDSTYTPTDSVTAILSRCEINQE